MIMIPNQLISLDSPDYACGKSYQQWLSLLSTVINDHSYEWFSKFYE